MDSVTASCSGVAGSSSTEKEQKFVPHSFIHNPPISVVRKFHNKDFQTSLYGFLGFEIFLVLSLRKRQLFPR